MADVKGGRWRAWVTLVATLVVVLVVVRAVSSGAELLAAARALPARSIALSSAASAGCVLLTVLRWQFLLRAIGCAIPLGRTADAVLATWPLSVIAPSKANELLRAVVVRDLIPVEVGVGSILVEKLFDLTILFALGAVLAAATGHHDYAAGMIALLVVELLALRLLVARRETLLGWRWLAPRREQIEQLFLALGKLRGRELSLWPVAATSLAIRLLSIAMVHVLLAGTPSALPLSASLRLWPLAILVGLLPVTLGGMGTRDAAFIALVSAEGHHVVHADLLVATLGYALVSNWLPALCTAPFLVRAGRRVALAKDPRA